MSGSLSGSIEAEPSSRQFQAPSFTAATIFIAGCVVVFVVSFTAFTMGFWQGSSLFWDCDAACVVQAHESARQAAWSRPLPRLVSLISHRAALLGSISRHISGRVRWALRWLLINANISSNLGSLTRSQVFATNWWIFVGDFEIALRPSSLQRKACQQKLQAVSAQCFLPRQQARRLVGLQGRAPRSCPECRDAE